MFSRLFEMLQITQAPPAPAPIQRAEPEQACTQREYLQWLAYMAKRARDLDAQFGSLRGVQTFVCREAMARTGELLSDRELAIAYRVADGLWLGQRECRGCETRVLPFPARLTVEPVVPA